MLTREEMQAWFVSFWNDIPRSSTRAGHPAPFPAELATRLIRMFSFAGDTILAPFVGTGSTCEAAVETGRNSIGVEIDPVYLKMAKRKLAGCCSVRRMFGPLESQLLVDYSSQAQLRRVSDPSLSGQQPAAVLV